MYLIHKLADQLLIPIILNLDHTNFSAHIGTKRYLFKNSQIEK